MSDEKVERPRLTVCAVCGDYVMALVKRGLGRWVCPYCFKFASQSDDNDKLTAEVERLRALLRPMPKMAPGEGFEWRLCSGCGGEGVRVAIMTADHEIDVCWDCSGNGWRRARTYRPKKGGE